MSPLVRDFAKFFDSYNHQITSKSNVAWYVGDAFQQLLASQVQYGVIASEPSNPWVTGVERLYSKEFLTLASQHLRPGGVYAQWFHEYDLSVGTIGMVINTFASVFPEVRIFKTTLGDIAVLGMTDPNWSPRFSQAEIKWMNEPVRKDLDRLQVSNIETLLNLEIPIPTEFFARYGEHTLDFPKLAYQAGYEFFLSLNTDLKKVAESAILKGWTRQNASHTLASLWVRRHPTAATLERFANAECKRPLILGGGLSQSPQCQQYLVRLAVLRGEKLSSSMSPLQQNVVEVLRDGSTRTPSVTTAANAAQALKFLSALDSPPLPANKEAILQLAKPCLTSFTSADLTCRLQMIKNLAAIGDLKAASVWYDDLQPYFTMISNLDLQEVKQTIFEASKARGMTQNRSRESF
jgi:hypothetical protein